MKVSRWKCRLVIGLLWGLFFVYGELYAQNSEAPKYRSHFVVYDVQAKTSTILFTLEGEWHAPNWTPDGKYFVADRDGVLYRIAVNGDGKGKPEKVFERPNLMVTNDHALSWDGRQIALTGITMPMPATIRTPADIPNPMWIMNVDGSDAREVHPGWFHGWSPDARYLVYAQFVGERTDSDLYRVGTDGSGELRMTTHQAQDDGPEYSADGKWVYFCSDRSGKWDAWRMPADGAGPDDRLAERITFGEDTQDWFPHISPDGRWLYTISYPMDHPDHGYIGEGMQIKVLPLENGLAAPGATLTPVRTFFGGQGSGNTGGWSPDSNRFVWTEYETLQETSE